MDKNQTIGFVLLSAMLVAYLYFFAPSEQPQVAQPAKIEQVQQPAQEQTIPQATQDSLLKQKYGALAQAMQGERKEVVLENELVRVVFSTQGAKVSEVRLKKYTTYTGAPLILLSEQHSKVKELVNTQMGEIDLNALYYQATPQGDSAVSFAAYDGGKLLLQKTYTLSKKDYEVRYDLKLDGLQSVLKQDYVQLQWADQLMRYEVDMKDARQRSALNFYTVSEDFDDITNASGKEEESPEALKWVSAKHRFFNAAWITDAQFDKPVLSSEVNEADTSVVRTANVAMQIPLKSWTDGSANLRFYFGPNAYEICKEVAPGFGDNVNLGWVVFAPINKFLIIPIFNFLESYISNYGVIIFLLVLIVKSMLFPLTYRSYISMAKMKVLKPEIDKLKDDIGDDQMKLQQAQMQLYQQAGVNPLSGCIPMLAQMPFFFAMFNFFPNAIQLRQEPFLWATDLASYDSILNLPFTLPFYGSHVSLFTLLWAGSTLLYTHYNNQASGAASNPQMKMMSYITPVFFVVFFNSLPSGLTYYYFVSNLISIAQQLLSRRFINEDKILRIIEENKKKNVNKPKGGMAKRLEEAMKTQQERAAQIQKEKEQRKNKKKEE